MLTSALFCGCPGSLCSLSSPATPFLNPVEKASLPTHGAIGGSFSTAGLRFYI